MIDDFHPDPDRLREEALRGRYQNRGNHPGLRAEPSAATCRELGGLVAEAVRREFGCELAQIHFAFQCNNRRDRAWIHSDTDVDYAAVLYLAPNAPPGTGTSFFGPEPPDARVEEPVDCVENVYNRLVLYRAGVRHRATAHFGDGIEDGRLFVTAFIERRR